MSSEFGTILGSIHGGHVISSEGSPRREDGTIVFISSAFNPLTLDQLREVADYMDKEEWKSS